ncbi:hypothetical protein GCM10027284_02190 [Cyclobacterium sediminis]
MNRKIVLVKGAYGDANIGDDLLLEIVIEALNIQGFNNSNIVVTAKNSNYMTNKFSNIKVISPARSRFVNSHYLILGGGTQFFSFKKVPVNKKNKFGIYFNIIINDFGIIFDFLKSKFSKKLDSKKIALGIGLGPFHNENKENKVKSELASFSQVLCRDKQSLYYCEKWGVKSELIADMCLSDLFRKRYPYHHFLNQNKKKVLGIVLRDWIQNDSGNIINNQIFEIISEFSEFEVKLFVFSKIKDKELISHIRTNNIVNEDNFYIWDPDSDDFSNYLNKINLCDFIITSRYHAAIFALNFNIPTICLAIDPKLKFLSQEVNGFSYCEISDIPDLRKLILKQLPIYNQIQKEIANSYTLLNKRANKILNIF